MNPRGLLLLTLLLSWATVVHAESRTVRTEELFDAIAQETQSDGQAVCDLVERMAPGKISASDCIERVPIANAECREILLANYPDEVPFDPHDESNKIIKHLTEGQVICPFSRILGWDFFVTEDGPKVRFE